MELYHILRSKPLAAGRPTSNSHGGGAQPTATIGGRGEPTPQGNTGGEGGGYHGLEGGEASSAAPYVKWAYSGFIGTPARPILILYSSLIGLAGQ